MRAISGRLGLSRSGSVCRSGVLLADDDCFLDDVVCNDGFFATDLRFRIERIEVVSECGLAVCLIARDISCESESGGRWASLRVSELREGVHRRASVALSEHQ